DERRVLQPGAGGRQLGGPLHAPSHNCRNPPAPRVGCHELMLLTLEDLEYENLIGQGAFGVVQRFRVRDTGRKVAVKRLRDSSDHAIRRFSREVEFLSSLSPHRNIVQVLGNGVSRDLPYYVMPLAPANLAGYLAEHNQGLKHAAREGLF